MSHFGDFMDGVPVKISEKYKRPPKIELPYSVQECPLRANNVVANANYCSTFEQNVLKKLKELRSAKETKKSERRHRLQLLGEAKQKKLDAIATVEAEEKLKQLSVSEVSYPSTEEISALSPDDKLEANCDISVAQDSPEANVPTDIDVDLVCKSNDSQSNILQPIQVSSNYQQCNLLDDPDPLQEIKMNTKIVKPQYSQNVATLTYKDFENDTSSPFDNVELKTINEMELLAQVLQSHKESVTSCTGSSYVDQTYPGFSNCSTQAQVEGMTYLPTAYPEQTVQGQNFMYASPQHFPVSNGYYVPSEPLRENNMAADNVYVPNYQYYVPTQPFNVSDQFYNLPTTSSNIGPVSNDVPYNMQQQYYFPQNNHYSYTPQNFNAGSQTIQAPISAPSSQNMVKSRSRSVPDIVKELNEELATAKLRAKEISWNISPEAPVNVPQPTSSTSGKKVERRRKSEQLPNPYDKFPPKLQNMCQQIHGMGFPLDRVARVCSLVGDNDKKVIECLLILGELMDLGFSEGRASTALAKHDFNREKALDDLVS
ncbi:unnamed protein product [Leptidea sinapis]|uniref:UBA domain-containing protein n=1 Tax=Leptidea sinapis TaxID=189913 RepID=A0A5E4QME3_9NEOP|nr:unnamed protein product [Leptidea sinapis]